MSRRKKSYYRYPERDPIKNCFLLPNEIFQLDLSPGAKIVYAYLLYVENRSTYECHVSYRSIGSAVGMCKNTAMKYVAELVDAGLIKTRWTKVTAKDGSDRNGSLRYHIRPIQEAVDRSIERRKAKLDADVERLRAQKKLAAQKQKADAPRDAP